MAAAPAARPKSRPARRNRRGKRPKLSVPFCWPSLSPGLHTGLFCSRCHISILKFFGTIFKSKSNWPLKATISNDKQRKSNRLKTSLSSMFKVFSPLSTPSWAKSLPTFTYLKLFGTFLTTCATSTQPSTQCCTPYATLLSEGLMSGF